MSWAEAESVRNQNQPVPKVTTKENVKCMVRSRRMDSVKCMVRSRCMDSVKCMVRSRCMDSVKYMVDEENL